MQPSQFLFRILIVIGFYSIFGFSTINHIEAAQNDLNLDMSTKNEDNVTLLQNNKSKFGNYALVWTDEFDGNSLNLTKWEHMTGDGRSYGLPAGWGNSELEYYTSRSQNINVENGCLTITACKEAYSGCNYTSGRIRTKNKKCWKYGRIEMRARLPRGKGIWPAFWMLPTNEVYGGWAASGEIDITEMVGHEPNKVYGTLHYGGSWPNNTSTGNSYQLSSGVFADEFHVFALEWQEGEMRWYVDDTHYQTQKQWWSSGGAYPAPFDQPFHILLNVAVGGNWPGNPGASTVFPQQLVVDYIRVYQDTTSTEVDDLEYNSAPAKYELAQNYPNPCNPITRISYSIAESNFVTIKLYNVLGEEIKTLVADFKPQGLNFVNLFLDNLTNGIYLYRMEAGSFSQIRKLVVAK